MSRHTRIPLVKNRVIPHVKEKRLSLVPIGIIVLCFALMVFFVWIKVQTNIALVDIQRIEARLDSVMIGNEKSKADKVQYSSFGRIHKIARDTLNLEFIPHENIIQISPE